MAELKDLELDEVVGGAEEHNIILNGTDDSHYIDVDVPGHQDFIKEW